MTVLPNTKVTANHLKRDAYLYVRQSTIRQVFENQESTKRQYGLRQRAVALGWPIDNVVVIDSDLGQSGASAADREGFQRLVAEVSMGHAGIVLGLEVSRLARNSSDWHRLLEICALSQTLILDEDGVYDPCEFNDRLLLGLKGTMSEAELHVLRARLRGGMLNKARRGELRSLLPVGFIYDARGQVVLDPDKQVQTAIHNFFATFRSTGTARATIKELRQAKVLFPRRIAAGVRKGDLVWGEICHCRALQVLHNPHYAGAYFFGRHRTGKRADGSRKLELVPRDQWYALLPDAHPGYISWEEFERNQRQLLEHAQAHGRDRRKSPAREGPALLQGIVLCGKCGSRMTVRYQTQSKALCPIYVCQREGISNGKPICESIPGHSIDDAVGALLVEMMSPVTIELALAVQHELTCRIEATDKIRRQQVERARYAADLARQRFMQVDPNNRLVADTLEAEWNEKLREMSAAQDEYERCLAADKTVVDEHQREQILALASDFPRLWKSDTTTMRDRKRMIRLLVEDVTLVRNVDIHVHVRFRGGTTRSITLPKPQSAWEMRQTRPEVVQLVDDLLGNYSFSEIAHILNERGYKRSVDAPFNIAAVKSIKATYALTSRQQRLQDAGLLTRQQLAKALGVSVCTITTWRKHGLLTGTRYNGRGEWFFPKPNKDSPRKQQGQKLAERAIYPAINPHRTKEV